ncbi:FixH family protein [Sphingobium subterraneum]|uniref:Nitrogen fixation protein FixH n=1 Tax=Sphingobium subterraneum TaxID=627688 RepID=A0A841J207_9SPHN|nr:FixH family protein [Sphingobium subterraneum]MBB6124857.1 nitrogen fixation protein FixH [Sphingobium subterraneum]
MTQKTTHRPFTGWHMTIILVTFFAIVMAVNFTMARIALSSFGGTVVDNSYVASQHYNAWLAQADAQQRLGWDKTVTLDDARHLVLTVRKDGVPLDTLRATATVSHPLGLAPARALHFATVETGGLRSVEALPPGRWRIDLAVSHGDNSALYQVDLQ